MTKVPIVRTVVTAAYIGPGDVIVVPAYSSQSSARGEDHLLCVASAIPPVAATGKISLLCNYPDHGTVIVERLSTEPIRVVSLALVRADQLLPEDIIRVGTNLHTVRQATHNYHSVTLWTEDAISLHYALADMVVVVNWTMRVCDGPLQVTNGPAAVDLSHYPHTCPKCGAPAYLGSWKVDCSRGASCAKT